VQLGEHPFARPDIVAATAAGAEPDDDADCRAAGAARTAAGCA
jgi:hypothetical protein